MNLLACDPRKNDPGNYHFNTCLCSYNSLLLLSVTFRTLNMAHHKISQHDGGDYNFQHKLSYWFYYLSPHVKPIPHIFLCIQLLLRQYEHFLKDISIAGTTWYMGDGNGA